MPSTEENIAVARKFVASGPKRLHIGGAWVAPRAGGSMEVVDPSTEQVLCSVAEAGAEDVDAAVKAARAAFENDSWAAVGPHDRARFLLRIASLIEANLEELAAISSLEMGMPFKSSIMTTTQMIDVFQYYAGWATKIYGQTIPTKGPGLAMTLREPYGVVAVIIPWNGPILYTCWKVAVALATGNTVVLKPAEDAPLTCVRFAEIIQQAELPPGVFNLVTGRGEALGDPLVAHPDVAMITFTGSTSVGQHIMQTASKGLKKLSLELGGKSPLVIFADADLKKAVPMAVGAFTQNAGQACTAGTRLFVHESIFEDVVGQLVEGASKLKLGLPFDDETQVGPIISAKQLKTVTDYVQSGRDEGATIHTGGERLDRSGYFFRPTVVTDATPDMKIVREEIFGPVGCVIPFSSVEDALAKANATEYGLAASVWTSDLGTAQTMMRGLKAGMVWVNTHFELDVVSPFGGYKQSGIGRELGEESVYEFMQTKSVLMRPS